MTEKITTLAQLQRLALREKSSSASEIAALAELTAAGLEAVQHTGITVALPVSGWQNGAQTVKHQAFLADGACWYLICGGDVTAEDITVDGQITFRCENTPEADRTVSILRLETNYEGSGVGRVFNLTGPKGDKGEPGERGPAGAQGPAGPGVPSGGAAGQVLAKQSAADYAAVWTNPPETGVTAFNGRTGAVVPLSGDYTAAQVGALPSSGGTLTGNLRIKGSGNYGTQINFGDSDYVHIAEPTDDCLEIKAKQIHFVVSDTTDSKFTLNGSAIGTGGTAASADRLTTPRSISVSLGTSAVAAFDGSANVTTGVKGTLPIANGGTGQTSIVSTAYTSNLYRGILFTLSTPTSVANGCIALVYS